MYQLKLKHHFSAAHHLEHAYSKECNRPEGHGHSFEVIVQITVDKLHENMIVDFKKVKHVIDQLDHRYLNKILDFEPTAERLVEYLQKKIFLATVEKDASRKIDVVVELFEGPGASIKYPVKL